MPTSLISHGKFHWEQQQIHISAVVQLLATDGLLQQVCKIKNPMTQKTIRPKGELSNGKSPLRWKKSSFIWKLNQKVSNKKIQLIILAHCTVGRAGNSINVVVGTATLNAGGVTHRSNRIINHASYNVSIWLQKRTKEIYCLDPFNLFPRSWTSGVFHSPNDSFLW